MANMIPADIPSIGPGARAERLLFDQLREALSDEFFVYSRLQMLDDTAREREADFVILHRERGLLLVECKGGGVQKRRDGTWVRLNGQHEAETIQNPWEQARQNLHALQNELHERLQRVFPDRYPQFPLAYGYAVAFPLAEMDVPELLPVDLPAEVCWDAAAITRLADMVHFALDFWQGQARSSAELSISDFKRFRRRALQPVMKLAPTLGARIQAEGEAIRRLSEQQAEFFAGIVDNRRVRVSGGPGTGKTVLAMEAARELASQGARVLFICFNKHLAQHLRLTIADEGISQETLRVDHFHRLCRAAFVALGQEPQIPDGRDKEAARAFWDEEAPMVLLEAIMDGKMPRFDAIVADEVQDFLPAWWDVVEEFLEDREHGRIIAFQDPRQTIFGRASVRLTYASSFRLTKNFRNSRQIASILENLSPHAMPGSEQVPSGEPVQVFQQGSRSKTIRDLERIVEKLVVKEGVPIENIVILTPHTQPNSSLADVNELSGWPLTADPQERGGKLLHMTIGGFKGLESDVVILLDVDSADPRCDRNAQLVGASRAKHLLYVFAKGVWPEAGP